ncbi:hypothetical protein Bhyg_11441 [Pseudolycoriella hygida]|uniref:Uncharacterized protein n=1 Tax=Pseudolycoriella hygida TaxID=35572 RepID=A0A9Q0MWX6_9DIPT|nr:hypothetical protein Bhyg_11441 [Pseudolycoriella hygida]
MGDEESNSHSQENRQKPQMVVSAQKTVTREDANNNLEFGSRAEKLQTLGPKVEKWMAKAHSLEEKIKSSEKEYVNQIKALREEIGQKSAALKVCQDQNYEMKLEMKQMKLNHSNELQSVKNRVTADLKKQLYDDLKQSQAGMSKLNSPSSVKATGKQRSCHNCGVRSRFCVTFAYCNQYCKGIFLVENISFLTRVPCYRIS